MLNLNLKIMKTMKITKLLGFLVFLAIITLSCEKDKETNEQSALANGMKAQTDCGVEVNLIAGQFTDVGNVIAVIGDDLKLTVTYTIDDPDWYMSFTHLDVQLAPVPESFPVNKKNNPKIGNFAYNQEHSPWVTSWTEVVDLPEGYHTGDVVYIAAHAVVHALNVGNCDVEEFASTLPDCANLVITGGYPGAPSYTPTETITLGGDLNGVYEGWCVDLDHGIGAGVDYTVAVYSSTEVLPDGTVDYPWNMPYVNWIINQHYVGTASPGGYGTYTYGDVQIAIWHFIDDGTSTGGCGAYDANRVAEIIAAAAGGGGFIPTCGEYIGVVLVPVLVCGDLEPSAQVTIIEVLFEYYGSETAWGGELNPEDFDYVYTFNSSNWAMYFDLTCSLY